MKTKTRRHERGIALIWTAIFLTVFIGFVGLSTDIGYSLLVAGQLQTAADAAALAGAQTLAQNQAGVGAEAILIAGFNKAAGQAVILTANNNNSAAGDIVLGTFNTTTRVFTPTTTGPNAVKVVAAFATGTPNGPLGLFFGPAFGVNNVNISRTAIAITQAGAGGGAGFLLLSPNGSPALSLTGNGNITVQGGNIVVDSSATQAVTLTGNGNITATSLDVVGSYKTVGNGTINGSIDTGAPAQSDPQASLPPPTVTNNLGTVSLTGNQSATLNPGYYPGGISLTGNGSLTLNPGIYNLGGPGLRITGNGSVTANGVMLYLSGTAGISLTGNGTVNITPPTSGTYNAMAIYQDRSNSTADSLTGNGSLHLDGVIYLPAAAVSLTGNGDTLGSELIAYTARLTGNGGININYAGGTKPPTAGSTYLVQ